jgi:type III pantothenate kinase
MKADVVVDVGNSRIKWGLCDQGRISAMATLPADEENAWLLQWSAWKLEPERTWAIASVNPQACARFVDWLASRSRQIHVLDCWQDLPLRIALAQPQRVGLDRLLNAVAARERAGEGSPAVIVDAGSAVTVDFVDESGAFRGGAISPGLRLMSMALHDYTALLPTVGLPESAPVVPASSTAEAVQAGIFWSAVGGIRCLIEQMSKGLTKSPTVFLTGGDGRLLSMALRGQIIFWPEMTLEGIRLTVEALP